ncbi:MAG: DUF3027 domain-containing protein [Chloroflexi bacterium]|nr:DUF3027 domain-containing protein [Chloroflexota bacterium]
MASDDTSCSSGEPLVLDGKHAHECHVRWVKGYTRNGPARSEEEEDRWHNEQCGQCRYYVPLEGALSSDWGACTNAKSMFDGRVMFEHNGCDQYSGANEWVSSYLRMKYEQLRNSEE